jgi:hypothetical protein
LFEDTDDRVAVAVDRTTLLVVKPDHDMIKIATEAYVYGYPLVYDLTEVASFVTGSGGLPISGPYNEFEYARSLLGPETKFVSPNNDTLYVVAMCDLGGGPLVLHVPDTNDRYYVLQFVDAWTNNFAYVGRRASGTGEAKFLLASHGYQGAVPDETQVIEVPTRVFSIVGRLQLDGEAELPAVHAIQDQFTLSPLGTRGEIAGVPAADPGVGGDLAWWDKFRMYLSAFPPPDGDMAFVDGCRTLGLLEMNSAYRNPEPALAATLAAGAKAGQDLIEQLAGSGAGEPRNGWTTAMHLFDYNVDRLGPGTFDSNDWKIADRKQAYVTRAVAARAGLWGNHGYEALYMFVWTDENGQPLDGAHRYELRFDTPPPADAFWSLTMYDSPNFYLVDNPIDRYSIGDRTPGFEPNPDGAVTILMQENSPGAQHESNWLPAPAGKFRPVLRVYQPKEDALSGKWFPSAVRRID